MAEPVESMSLWYRFVRSFCQVLFKFVFPCRVSGREHFPETGPVLLLSNHQSHLDPMIIAAAAPRRLRALARSSLFVGPFGWLIRSLGAIPVGGAEATLSSLRSAFRHFDNGAAILVFPEGTRSEDGKIAELKTGFVVLARRKSPTVLPMALDGTFEALSKHDWFPRPRRTAVVFGAPISDPNLDQLSDAQFETLAARRLAECHREAQRLRGMEPSAGNPSESAN